MTLEMEIAQIKRVAELEKALEKLRKWHYENTLHECARDYLPWPCPDARVIDAALKGDEE